MSRKLGALILAMGILVGAMAIKTVLSSNSNGTVVIANGSAPVPIPR